MSMEVRTDIDALIEALIEREGGYVGPPRRQRRPDLLRDYVTRCAGAHLCGTNSRIAAKRGRRNLPPPLLAAPALRRGRQAQRPDSRRAVRHGREHGAR